MRWMLFQFGSVVVSRLRGNIELDGLDPVFITTEPVMFI
jgi:hypothetical protein